MNITYIEYNTDYASIPKRNEGGAERINDINTAQNSELHAVVIIVTKSVFV
jgi:hypothetical protein